MLGGLLYFIGLAILPITYVNMNGGWLVLGGGIMILGLSCLWAGCRSSD